MVLGTAAPVPAAVITYTTPPGGLAVSAEPTFTTGPNSLTIVVNNLQANPTSVSQSISDLDFVTSTGQTVVGPGGGITSSSGTSRTVNDPPGDNNTFTDGGLVPT